MKKKKDKRRKQSRSTERRKTESTPLQTSTTKRGAETPEVLTTSPTSFIADNEDITVFNFQRAEKGHMYVVPAHITFLTTSMVSDHEIFRHQQLCYV
jgi:hypothetical protein